MQKTRASANIDSLVAPVKLEAAWREPEPSGEPEQAEPVRGGVRKTAAAAGGHSSAPDGPTDSRQAVAHSAGRNLVGRSLSLDERSRRCLLPGDHDHDASAEINIALNCQRTQAVEQNKSGRLESCNRRQSFAACNQLSTCRQLFGRLCLRHKHLLACRCWRSGAVEQRCSLDEGLREAGRQAAAGRRRACRRSTINNIENDCGASSDRCLWSEHNGGLRAQAQAQTGRSERQLRGLRSPRGPACARSMAQCVDHNDQRLAGAGARLAGGSSGDAPEAVLRECNIEANCDKDANNNHNNNNTNCAIDSANFENENRSSATSFTLTTSSSYVRPSSTSTLAASIDTSSRAPSPGSLSAFVLASQENSGEKQADHRQRAAATASLALPSGPAVPVPAQSFCERASDEPGLCTGSPQLKQRSKQESHQLSFSSLDRASIDELTFTELPGLAARTEEACEKKSRLHLNTTRSGQATEGARDRAEVMDILRHAQMYEDRLQAPKTYPNNTLIADLNKCHRNITNLWPSTTQATTTTLSSIKSCWPLLRDRRKGPRRRLKAASKYTFEMPDSLLRTNVRLKSDDYDRALSVLTSDVRYQLHLLLYRRVQVIWTLLSTILCILVPILLANLESLMIVGAFLVWLGFQIIGAFVTAQFRKKLDEMLEKSVAQVNSFFMDHNLMLGVINVGGLLSKAKLLIPMLYFDTSQCREQIESIISIDSRKDADGSNDDKHILDYSRIDLPMTKPNVMAFAQSQLAKKIVLRYSQRWISYFEKRRLMFTDDQAKPRHLSTGKCLCQFIEDHFKGNNRPNEESKHNQPSSMQNTFRNTKATLILNGKQQRPEQVETEVRPQVMRKYAQMAPTIPTLSRLVSMKEQSEHFKIDMESSQVVRAQDNHDRARGANGYSAQSLWSSGQHQQPTSKESGGMALINRADRGPSPASSPDISLELGGGSTSGLVSGGEDLVRKLRLLLELRKNELSSIDSSLFSCVLYKASQQLSILNEEDASQLEAKLSNDDGSIADVDGKRFFSQREGLFFLGSEGTKKSQPVAPGNNHVLEIC